MSFINTSSIMPVSKLQQTAREIGKERAAVAKEVSASRKKAVRKANASKGTKTIEVISEPLPQSAMTTTVNISAESVSEATEVIKSAVSYIGGKNEVTISRETLTLLHENKIFNDRAMVIACLMMEYGSNFITTGMDFFEGEGELVKFALAYNLDPVKVLATLTAIKALNMPLEKMNLQMSLELTFPGE